MRQLSRTDAPALRALAALCLSDPSNPATRGYGVTALDVDKFIWEGERRLAGSTDDALERLERDGYARRHSSFSPPRFIWTPTARGWQAALMPAETVDMRA